jgi:CRP-like cAMP-binding protein
MEGLLRCWIAAPHTSHLIAPAIPPLPYPAGTTLFREGDKVCFCYVVLSGSVQFYKVRNKVQMEGGE